MFFLRIVLMALRSLRIHPLRTLLAMLGVIIGVGAVVAAMAILEGMGAQMASSFASMGLGRARAIRITAKNVTANRS